jgi:predicted small lipoprotein YifL
MSIAGLLMMAFSGCGYRGPLEPPAEVKQENQVKKSEAQRSNKTPDKPFVLDGVIE